MPSSLNLGLFALVSASSFFTRGECIEVKRNTPLSSICTAPYVQAALPAAGFYPGIAIDASSVQTTIVNNATFSSEWFPTSTISYCNVTFAYSHTNIPNDIVHVTYWVPSPSEFKNRYVSTGGGGLAINSGSRSIPTGIIAGAVSGLTDGGFGSFNTQWDAVFLAADGNVNWQSVHMFGYQAHHELATLGKEFAKKLFNPASGKIFSYYQGCSEGGREGWSQLQRFADQFDGAAIGAPAFRFGQQQVNHLTSNVIEQTLGYYPPPCELEKVVNLTIAACDPLDGRIDGVIARSDLCKLQFNIKSTIGTPYYCAASSGGGGGGPPGKRHLLDARQFPGGGSTPEQNGTISAKGVAVASAILAGLHDSQNRLAYLSYQPGAGFSDARTAYSPATSAWTLSISGLGGEWVRRFLQLKDEANLPSLAGVTYDTLRDWMAYGQAKYTDTLQTTHPDLTDLKAAGAKVVHVHGEADDSIPAASSVHYYESVKKVMFPALGFKEGSAALDEFYRLYLVPGGAHCGKNRAMPNGPWPQTTLQTVIDWVEKGVKPDVLSAVGGTDKGIDSLCRWPLRPLWKGTGKSAKMECVYDQKSVDTWKYEFDAYKLPVY
ncbi:Tannase/feruloyl esterase [Bombardia bombarda]|uniref:Carboxylic ester hydrolase n=1 Tax=Bombardia bombarda TaxID=252184 RepID=A0AA40CGC1_9PEZI|nr:Tannase/feruloyl esterase [Bombardia bombarda]